MHFKNWRIVIFSVAILTASCALQGIARAEAPLNLLYFGNSFTIRNYPGVGEVSVADHVANLAVSAGHARPRTATEVSGGRYLSANRAEVKKHPKSNVDAPAMADGDTWDFVVIQGYSSEATAAAGKRDKFLADAIGLYKDVRDHPSGHGAGVKPVLYQTWAYFSKSPFYPGTWADPATMQAEISEGYRLAAGQLAAVAGKVPVRLAPVGESFASLDFAFSLYTEDLKHPSLGGRLLAGMILYRTIYDEKIASLAWEDVREWSKVSEREWKALSQAADNMAIPEPPSP